MERKWMKAKLNYKVVCAWCGVTIRRDKAEDSQGMCTKCYCLILREHLRSQRQATIASHASER